MTSELVETHWREGIIVASTSNLPLLRNWCGGKCKVLWPPSQCCPYFLKSHAIRNGMVTLHYPFYISLCEKAILNRVYAALWPAAEHLTLLGKLKCTASWVGRGDLGFHQACICALTLRADGSTTSAFTSASVRMRSGLKMHLLG
jgi:hypothetical protein